VVGMGVSISGLGFTCPSGPEMVTYPSGNYGYVFNVETVAQGRYVDSYNLIQANKLEIQDKSLASIAIAHSDFYFPGDNQTNSRSRYYDSYRLIQNNKSVIVGTAWTDTYNVYPGISTTMNKCKRDLGYYIDAISTDIFTGGNHYTREFVRQYFDSEGNPISNGLVGEVEESIFAFYRSSELMKRAITNTLVGAAYSDLTITPDSLTGSNTSEFSCADVQSNIDNLYFIVYSVITSGDLSIISNPDNYGTFTTGGNKCHRDIGYLIDATSLDVRDFTNKNTREFIKGYFDANGNPLINGIIGEVPESITAFNSVRDYCKLAINNQLNKKDFTIIADPVTGSNTDPTSCSDVRSFIDNLIATVTSDSVGIATSKLNLPSLSSPSTIFTINVGTSTLPHTYVPISGGTVKTNVVRPFDGQVLYFKDLYYSVGKIVITDGGSGYSRPPSVTIDSPVTPWGVSASAVCEVSGGRVTSIEIISSGRGYTSSPRVTIGPPDVGINTAKASSQMNPTYYAIQRCTPISSGICTVTLNENVPYEVGIGTEIYFYKQSRVLASGHSFEYIGSGTDINAALPFSGGVPIQENETDSRNGGLVVYTSTDQSGNYRIGEGVVINQTTGTVSGSSYTKSLFSTLTPFILALGGE
jgi:hypothetical protein